MFVVFFCVGGHAWASRVRCDYALAQGSLQISESAEQDRITYNMPPNRFSELTAKALRFFDRVRNCTSDYSIIYDRRSYGFLMRISAHAQAFVLDGLKPATFAEERTYYHDLANCEGIRTATISLPYSISGKRSIEISPEMQIKLREKHDVSLQEIREAFLNRVTAPQASDFQNQKHPDCTRYGFYGRTSKGRRLKIVFDVTPQSQSLFIVTVYDERH